MKNESPLHHLNIDMEAETHNQHLISIPFVRFTIVGLLGTMLNLMLLAILVEFFNTPHLYASLIAILISILHNFLLNNCWAFSSRKYDKSFLNRFVAFNLASIGSLTVNFSVFALLTRCNMWYLTAQAMGILSAYAINYLINDHFTFCDKTRSQAIPPNL